MKLYKCDILLQENASIIVKVDVERVYVLGQINAHANKDMFWRYTAIPVVYLMFILLHIKYIHFILYNYTQITNTDKLTCTSSKYLLCHCAVIQIQVLVK